MQTPRLDSDEVRCPCGRPMAEATTVTFSTARVRYLFRRCECGGEWTERLPVVDRTIPVTSDEILDVHARLSDFEGPLDELLGLKSA